MAKSVYLLGAGGHGRVVLDTLHRNNIQVTGILDPELKPGEKVWGVPVIGKDNYLENLSNTETLVVNGLGANPHTAIRRQLFIAVKQRGFEFMSLIHPSAFVSSRSKIDQGSQVMAGALLQCGVTLGQNVVINTRASIDHDCLVEAHSFIGPGAILCGNVIVSNSTFIGAGATILPGLKIGANAIIGAGAVVVKTVPQKWIVAGSPAVKISMNELTR